MHAPPITAKPSLSPQSLSDLIHLSSLLHLAHHRNKNQHRRAPFYRPFSILRRHLARIIALYTSLSFVPETHTARHKKRAQDKDSLARLQAEVVFLAEQVVPRCHRAFSQLVADLRFGVLGVFLLGVLARVCGVLGVSGWYEDVAEGEVGDVLRRFEKEEWGDEEEEDAGVVVRREAVEEDGGDGRASMSAIVPRLEDVTTPTKPGSSPDKTAKRTSTLEMKDSPVNISAKRASIAELTSSPTKTPAKRAPTAERSTKKNKKRKTGDGDAIDDLFDGL